MNIPPDMHHEQHRLDVRNVFGIDSPLKVTAFRVDPPLPAALTCHVAAIFQLLQDVFHARSPPEFRATISSPLPRA